MIRYPLSFDVKSLAHPGIQTGWITSANGQKVECAVPECFEGDGKGLSPEDLYAMALLNCFLATFKVYAEKSRMSYDRIFGNARLLVDRNETGSPWMARVQLEIDLWAPDNVEKAERLMKRVRDSSMILQSVRSQLDVTWKIHPKP